tara:strand:+ start:288 stop:533 length:246 start_codon:yes stop_codon:yes gene_type:complete
MLFPSRHGEIGNAITEIYYFSQGFWKKLFKQTNWKIKKIATNRLFYTGNAVFGARMPVRLRKILSFILGSSCNLFILEKIQ